MHIAILDIGGLSMYIYPYTQLLVKFLFFLLALPLKSIVAYRETRRGNLNPKGTKVTNHKELK